MALRIIKVDRENQDHWEHAKNNGFWDMPKKFQLDDGDTVVFWRSGSPGRILGQATVVGSMMPLGPQEPHAWSPGDVRRGQYRHRVPMADFRDLPRIDVHYGDFGLSGRPSVEQVPDGVTSEFVKRVGLRLSWADLAFGQLVHEVESGGEEPRRYDEDHRVRLPGSVVLRRGAPKFRRELLMAYSGKCAVTATSIPGLLEAAHISRYKGDHTDKVPNGLLLRSDIHTLFDLHLLTVLPDSTIRIAPDALGEPYSAYDGTPITLPIKPAHRPGRDVLSKHNEACMWLDGSTDRDGAPF